MSDSITLTEAIHSGAVIGKLVAQYKNCQDNWNYDDCRKRFEDMLATVPVLWQNCVVTAYTVAYVKALD